MHSNSDYILWVKPKADTWDGRLKEVLKTPTLEDEEPCPNPSDVKRETERRRKAVMIEIISRIISQEDTIAKLGKKLEVQDKQHRMEILKLEETVADVSKKLEEKTATDEALDSIHESNEKVDKVLKRASG